MAKNQTAVSADVDALLDGTIDDLKDKPEFKAFPPGGHLCQVFMTPKAIKDVGSGVEITLKAIETMELASPDEDKPLEKGAETSVFLFFSHENPMVSEFGQGTFKEIMAVLKEKYGQMSNRKLMEAGNGNEMIVITGLRSNKDKTQSFTSIEAIQFPE